MATKWLEERWEWLLPVLEPLGTAQEEHIKTLCKAELEAWRRRPGMRQECSLQPPLSQTRTHIREHLPLTNDNWWINPKSGAKEHLALKYLNFSTDEWIDITLPSEAELQSRWDHPLPLAHLLVLVEKAEHLLQSMAWAEIVVGVGLSTGRSIVEILHTGHFTPKTAYSILFAGPMTVYEQMCAPFEVPTLVRAELVFAALSRLRQFFKEHFLGMERRAISQQCRTQVKQAAFEHLQSLVPLRPAERNLYKQLSHGVYPRLATLFYCPASVDEILYMATIQNHRKTLEATSSEEQLAFALAASHLDYMIVDEQGTIDHRRGIRLGEPGVEVLEAFNGVDADGSSRGNRADEKQQPALTVEKHFDEEGDDEEKKHWSDVLKHPSQQQTSMNDLNVNNTRPGKRSRASDVEAPVMPVKENRSVADTRLLSIEDVKAAIAAHPDIDPVSEWDEEDLEVLRQSLSLVILDKDGTIDHRRGIRLGEPGVTVLEGLQQTETAVPADLMRQRELQENFMADEMHWEQQRKRNTHISLDVRAYTQWVFEDVQYAERQVSTDETFATLFATYGWVYQSGLLEQVKRFVGTAFLNFLTSNEESLLTKAMNSTGVTEPFAFLQKATLAYAHECLHTDTRQEQEKELQPTGHTDVFTPLVLSHEETVVNPPLALDTQRVIRLGDKQEQQDVPEDALFDIDAEAQKRVIIQVSPSTWERLVEIKEEMRSTSDEDVVEMLCDTYGQFFSSEPCPLFNPSPMVVDLKALVSTALSCVGLDGAERMILKQAMLCEQVSDPFDFLQKMVLRDSYNSVEYEIGEEWVARTIYKHGLPRPKG